MSEEPRLSIAERIENLERHVRELLQECDQLEIQLYLKVLPLPEIFVQTKAIWASCVEEDNRMEPVFNRNGFYLNRKNNLTWIEIDGEAWQYSNRPFFQYELDVSEGNNRMHPRTFAAIAVLIEAKVADKRLRRLYELELDIRMLQDLRREMRKQVRSSLKSFSEEAL